MKKEPLSAAALLRQKAEEQLKAQTHGDAAPRSDIDTLRLVHELEVHQIELEMQNDELMLAKHKAEDAAHQFTDLYDFAPSGYLSLSREGNITQLNFRAASLLGKERGNLLNKRFGLYVSLETQAVYTLFFGSIFENKGKQSCEINLISNTAEPTCVFLKGIYVEVDDKCIVTLFDITERKKAEEKLKKSEEKYRLLFENMNEAFSLNEVILDENKNTKDFRILLTNKAYEKHTGLKPEAIIGKTILEIMPDADLAQIEAYGKVALTGNSIVFEYFSKTFSRHMRVKAFCPEPGKFATIFEDITERKQAAETIKISEARYSALFNNSPMPLAINNEHLQITFLNSAFIKMYGYTLEDIPTLDQWFPKAYPNKEYRAIIADAWLAELTRVIHTGDAFVPLEANITCKNGSHRTALVSASPFSPEFEGEYLIVFQDITERKKAEESLKESEEKYRELFENSLMSISVVDLTGKLVHANAAYARMYGYKSVEEMINLGINTEKFYANPNDRKKVLQIMQQESQLQPCEIEVVRRDGTHIWVLVSAQVIKDTAGNPILYQADHIDITQRLHAEKALKESEEKFRNFFNLTADLVVIASLDGYFLQINPNWSKVLGYSDEELLGKPYLEFVHPDDKQNTIDVISEKLKQGETVFLFENRYLKKNGDSVLLEWTSSPNMELGLTFAIARDITERKKAEAVLHDIIEKNPMSIQIVNPEGYTLQVNAAHFNLFGSAPPSTFSIFEDLQQKAYGDYISQAKNGDVVHMPDIFYNTHDISPELPDMPRWIRALIFPLNDSTGKPERYVLMHENITERKQAEEALKVSEEKYHELSDSITDVFFALDKDLLYTYWNKAWETLTGVTAENAIGKSLLDIFPDNPERQQVENLVRNVNETKTQKQIVVNYPGNNAYIHEITAYPGDGGVSVFVKDITERKRAEQQLQQASENWSKTFDAIQDGIILLDQNQNVMASNQAFLSFVGKTKEQVIGTRCYEIVHGTECPVEHCPFVKLSWSKKRETTEMELNGISCQVMVDPIVDSENKLIGAVHIVTDISQRKKAEKAIQDKVVELQRFFDVTIGRELKMIELKQEINELARQLGEQEDRYLIVD